MTATSATAAAVSTFDPSRHAYLHPTPGDRPGLFFIGLSLSRNTGAGAPTNTPLAPAGTAVGGPNLRSVTRQTQFDFDKIQDRAYARVAETNDDGWLVGGGEADGNAALGGKLPAPDSAHVELLHVGTADALRGGLSLREVDRILTDRVAGTFAPLRVKPTAAALNGDDPPEWELNFSAKDNPGLVALQAQLAGLFQNRLRELPDHLHMSVARKVRFRSAGGEAAFKARAGVEVARWRARYPHGAVLTPEVGAEGVTQLEADRPGGIYLFSNRNTILKYYPPASM